MQRNSIRSTLPYAVGLAVAALLFFLARHIDYSPRAGALGPDFWPRTVIGLMAAACLFEIVKILLGLKVEARGVADALESEEAEEAETKYPWLLVGGIALVTLYAFVVDYLGFLLSTFLFLAAFMYLGRCRHHRTVWLTSAGITVAAAILFMRITYVSLPRGVPPFDAFTDFIRTILGG